MNRRLPPALVFENTKAVVKWFNTRKGYGFVTPEEGDKDALLHISVLSRAGHQTLPENTTIVCDIAEDQRGWQVSEVHEVDISTGTSRPLPPESDFQNGIVKFYNPLKGYGFIQLENGGQDVFVASSVLEQNGLNALDSDQAVRLTTRDGQRGPQAVRVELANQ